MAEDGVGEDAEGLYDVGLAPARMSIIDIADPDQAELTAQYNPADFEEILKVDWAKQKPPGLTHRRLHYTGTENPELSLDLVFDAHTDAISSKTNVEDAITRLMDTRNYLRSLCYPRQGDSGVRDGQAPRLLFKWPKFLTLTCVITELSFKYERFHQDGRPTRFTVKVKIEGIIVEDGIPLYSELVRGDFF